MEILYAIALVLSIGLNVYLFIIAKNTAEKFDRLSKHHVYVVSQHERMKAQLKRMISKSVEMKKKRMECPKD